MLWLLPYHADLTNRMRPAKIEASYWATLRSSNVEGEKKHGPFLANPTAGSKYGLPRPTAMADTIGYQG